MEFFKPRSRGRRSRRDRRPQKKVQTPKRRRLNLHKMIEFKYELDYILEGLPENVKGTLKGSIIAKADKMDQNAALEFLDAKVGDGTIDKERAERIGRLLRAFCIYR